MSEKQIRDILRDVCADLDRHSRRVVRGGVRKIVLPAVLGAGLALTGCDSVQLYGIPDANPPEAGTKDGGVEAGLDVFPYMAPDAGPRDQKVEPAEAGAPDLMYGVADQVPADTMPPPDGPPVLPYMAPDSKPQPPDAGAQPPYMAPPFPDKGTP